MDEAQNCERIHIERGSSDIKFTTGEGQWDAQDRRQREIENKPTLTFNSAPQQVRKVTGQIRNLNPAVKVSAGDPKATKEVAEVYEGLIREIEYRCDAQSVYEGAAESAALCGIGHFRIRADFCDYEGFDQHLIIERVFNPFSVFYDPRAKDPTRKDAEYAFVVEEMSRDAFKAAYPKAALRDWTSDHKSIEPSYNWSSPDNVVVAEYFHKEYDEYEIAITAMGQMIKGPFPAGLELARKRKVRKPRVMWAKMSGDEVLEGPIKIPGEFIPVIAVTGEEIHNGEEVYRSGVIRHAKDALMVYNVMRTTSVEMTLLQPRAPYMVTGKQVAGLEAIWAKANTANRPYLPYNPDERAPGPPRRESPPIASQALVSEAQMAAEDIKRTTGIHDASLGARSNETSGIAIQSRQREADIATSVYSDNMVKAVAHAGHIMVSMIGEVYDSERVVRILGADDQEQMVAINGITMTQEGPQYVNDMTVGRYAVRISVGPTYANKKQEASDGMTSFMQAIPAAAPLIADLVAGAQDWPDADRISARLKKTLPPGVLEEDEGDDQDPQKAMQMQQQQQMAQQQQAEQMQMQQAMQQIEMRKAAAGMAEAEADAAKAEADADKARADAEKSMLELQEMRVQINAPRIEVIPGQSGNQF